MFVLRSGIYTNLNEELGSHRWREVRQNVLYVPCIITVYTSYP